jgi:hypothetical protein
MATEQISLSSILAAINTSINLIMVMFPIVAIASNISGVQNYLAVMAGIIIVSNGAIILVTGLFTDTKDMISRVYFDAVILITAIVMLGNMFANTVEFSYYMLRISFFSEALFVFIALLKQKNNGALVAQDIESTI